MSSLRHTVRLLLQDRGLGRHVARLAKRDADRGRRERRRVVDAIAHEHGRRLERLGPNQRHLLLRSLVSVDLGDAHLITTIAMVR